MTPGQLQSQLELAASDSDLVTEDLSILTESGSFHGRDAKSVRPESSPSQIALSLVLHELCLQARLETNATGAIIAVRSGGKIAPHACAGSTAPEVSDYLHSRLSPLLLASTTPQRCDDTSFDTRLDAQTCRRLGLASFLIVPILQCGTTVGQVAIFSARSNSFTDRETLALQALAKRVENNLELVQQWSNHSDTPSKSGSITPENLEFRPKLQTSFRLPGKWSVWLYAVTLGLALIIGWAVGRAQRPRLADVPQQESSSAVITAEAAKVNAPPDVFTPTVQRKPTSTISGPPAGVPTTSAHGVAPARRPVLAPPNKRSAHSSSAKKLESKDSGSLVLFEDNAAPTAAKRSEFNPSVPVSASEKFRLRSRRSMPALPADVVRISPDVASAHIVRRVEPDYPDTALAKHVQGRVVLDVVVAEDGKVLTARKLSGDPQLVNAATHAIEQWQFKSVLQNGKPTKFVSTIVVNFFLP